MRLREAGWLLLLSGLPFSFFLGRAWGLDIWHSQTLWAQAGLLALWIGWGCQLDALPKLLRVWLGLVVGWTGALWVRLSVAEKVYPLPLLMGMGHLVVILLFLGMALREWRDDQIDRYVRGMAWAYVGVVAYSLLQLVSLDQFFVQLEPNVLKDVVVGTIGNPTHHSVVLALGLPMVLAQPQRLFQATALVALGLIGYLLLFHQSSTGFLAVCVSLSWWSWRTSPKWRGLVLTMWGLLGLGALQFTHLLNMSGRVFAWNNFAELVRQKPITGWGPGAVMQLSAAVPSGHPMYAWRHVHNEWLQVAIEHGLLGLVCAVTLALWLLWRAVKLPGAQVTMAGAIWVAFLVACSTLYPAHLWQTGVYALVAMVILLLPNTGRFAWR